ncbi:CubicO group peptidase (beta-lactamase class C family) [Arthrobacter sp. V4I6]|uniref:serine hydrolase domain-containing protein n=1 Tax=unclassified Arthrobacter TaxID=235627 RepID=UPI00277D9BA1|nr:MULTISPECIES: serine hydrolase domain-containing protein [unclassified Arthrobacter]MDQ0820905.1 CubicO group peptidase (beta-lactamase class C family) [Arthrobacter sp. V1I7]MDQ0855167.1 CubicO group peptidase (beta-lactamase class C family) [Arthrobacter sp. V4I6]
MTQDPVLAAALRTGLGPRPSRFAAAAVTIDDVTLAVDGVAPDADFEIGSISKGITGLLYVDACARGEIRPDATLGELLPLGGGAVAGLRLLDVSRHSSGLPRLPPGLPGAASRLKRTVSYLVHGTNPYGGSLVELLEQARAVRLQPPRPRYSNLGFELLGHAIAAGAGMGYRELVATRLCAPLGLDSVYLPATPAELRPEALTGCSRSGRAKEPWTGEALAPAGGIRASIRDMARLTQALLDGSAPGLSALDPVADFAGPAARIGAAWITLEVKRRRITWHNGATGGFRSWIGLDREAGAGVVLLSASSQPVDRHGFALLRELAAH